MDEKRRQLLNRRAQLSQSKSVLLELRLGGRAAQESRAEAAPDSAKEGGDEASCLLTEQAIIEIWGDLFGVKAVDRNDDFFEMGGNSLLAKRLFFEIENRLGKCIPPARLVEAPTVGQLSDLVQNVEDDRPWSALVSLKKGGARQPFFCVHEMDGDATVFLNLARHLDGDVPFYGIQAGMGGSNGPLLTSIEIMAESYVREIRTIQAEGPYQIGGSCFGGIVAYEMAQQLRAMGEKVQLLALVDTPCPPYPYVKYLRRNLEHFITRFRPRLEKCGNLALRQCKYLVNGNLLGWPDYLRADLSQIKNKLDLQQIRLRAMQDYCPKPYDGEVTLFLVSDPRLKSFPDIRLRWAELATDGAHVFEFSATHYNMFGEPNVRGLAEKFNTCFRQWGDAES